VTGVTPPKETDAPALAVIGLSDSFASAWPDLAEELAVRLAPLKPDSAPTPGTFAIIVAAGGEEERALEMLSEGLPRRDGALVYLVGARPSHRFAVEAIRCGSSDYFVLPPDLALLRRTLQARLETLRARLHRPAGGDFPDAFRHLVGTSPALRRTLEVARRIVHADVTVLITGETGTGKELLARALHDGSPRAAGPFVAVNCAAIPANLLESELFGHERGAFTDARQAKPGLFEEADGGTIFLDEVAQLPLELQGKLLRAVEDQRVRRVGATQPRQVDVRIIAATNTNLAAAVQRGEFREDLFYRLNVVNLELPPLRERGDDVALLAGTFIAALAERYRIAAPAMTPAFRAALSGHSWPGNVRELRHAIERALLLSPPGTLDPAQLVMRSSAGASPSPAMSGRLSSVILATAQAAVARCGGNKSAAARDLGVSRQRLLRILGELNDDGT
jgi:DNA-binding NtrC family response regulator